MRCEVSVTFEFMERAPQTWRGEVKGGEAEVVCRRAVERARGALKPYNWSSMVCCILERLEDETPELYGLATKED